MKFAVHTTVVASLLLAGTCWCHAQDMPEMPAPQPEHEWLQRFVGEWQSEAECYMDPDQPPMTVKGTETVRSIGGFWIVAEGQSEVMEMPFANVLTLGYDADKQKYVGTWIDSMTGHLWVYEGELDSTGQVLTLHTEGPCPKEAGKRKKFQEVTEFHDDDHRTFTSSMQGNDGEWTTVVVGKFVRTK